MISSLTSYPESIISFAFLPISVWLATASLNISPVEIWAHEVSFERSGQFVPFPHPGGPKRTIRVRKSGWGAGYYYTGSY